MLEMEIIKPNILEMELLGQEPSTIGGTTNYNELSGKPKINGVELIGNKTTKDLGIELEEIFIGSEEPTDEDIKVWIDPTEEAEEYAKKTDIPDVSNFITKDVTGLTNYYDKDDIDSLVGDIETLLGGI